MDITPIVCSSGAKVSLGNVEIDSHKIKYEDEIFNVMLTYKSEEVINFLSFYRALKSVDEIKFVDISGNTLKTTFIFGRCDLSEVEISDDMHECNVIFKCIIIY